MTATAEKGGVRLAELVAALSLGIDLGFGQPMEHVVRQTWIALRIAEHLGLDTEQRSVVYYTALLTNVGCHTDAHEQAKWFGDDIALKGDKYRYGLHGVRSAVAGLKTTSYAENVVALARAKAQGAQEALFANTAGQLCEGTGSNVFVVVAGELRTPPLSSGCLAGVTRELVRELTGAAEVDQPMSVLDEAEEVLLTSSTRDVQGQHRVDDRRLDAPGPVTRDAAAAFAALVARDVDP